MSDVIGYWSGVPVVVDETLTRGRGLIGSADPGGTNLDTGSDYLSPDCAVYKHGACSGDAWNPNIDQGVDCACWCHYVDQDA